MEEIDLAARARAAVRQRRQACAHKYETRKNGVERCSSCGDEFPCGSRCTHLDCIARAIKIRKRSGFPRDYPLSVGLIAPKHVPGDECPACVTKPEEHYDLLVEAGADPQRWKLPWPLESLATALVVAALAACTVRSEPYTYDPVRCSADEWNELLSPSPAVGPVYRDGWLCSTACGAANVTYEEHACYVVGDFDLDGDEEGGWINYVTEEFDRPGGCLVLPDQRMIRFFYCDEGL